MKLKYPLLIGCVALLAMVLSGCATGLTAASWSGVTADSKNAYIAGGPYVYAVNLQTGAQVWRYPDKASSNPFEAIPALTSDGQMIVGGFDKKLYALNVQNGQSNWQFAGAHDRYIGGALVVNNMIYAPNADYNLYALDLKGNLVWTFQADQSLWGAPVSDGTTLYFGSLGRIVYAVDAQTGKKVWKQEMDGAILGSPALASDNKTLFVGTYGGTVFALDTTTGATRWTAKVSSWIWAGPSVEKNNLYVGDANGKVWAFSTTDGSKLWETDLQGAVVGTPFITGSMLVVGTEVPNADTGYVYFLGTDGKVIHTLPLTGKSQAYANPVGAGDLVLVAPTGQATDPILVGLDSNGSIKWSFIPPK